ncbi:NAD(P)/FAD-dependent oxidoreductase [Natronorarus salvus]|uniref:NAD(P)/FAD-dependent oxidoreductase n=1 Tax=Natronorarus salvus TaxID=3117733 RepID=UPI002F26C7A4
MGERVGIVGAGVAGLACARELDGEAEVTILEKSRGVSGRAATRRKDDCRYDHGANYIDLDPDDELLDTIEALGTEGLIDIEGSVWVFDREGEIEPGHGDAGKKLSYERGITGFAKRLFGDCDADLRIETRAESLAHDHGTWTVADTQGGEWGPFDALVLTPPAPQTAALLADADWDDPLRERLYDAVSAVPFRTVVTAVLHYPFTLDVPYYALVNTDKAHEVGWLSREECKPGHVPEGESLLVCQMGGEWSEAHYDDPREGICTEAARLVSALLGDERLASPDWTDHQGWRYAIPEGAVEDRVVDEAAGAGLFLAGDWLVGRGRVDEAFEAGRKTGRRVTTQLGGA